MTSCWEAVFLLFPFLPPSVVSRCDRINLCVSVRIVSLQWSDPIIVRSNLRMGNNSDPDDMLSVSAKIINVLTILVVSKSEFHQAIYLLYLRFK